ncbi:hypothetical protein PQQ96_25480 [Paraburkholderia sediminicola]|uniref:hypothetical protein n=1 Tax=Paraburkholderia sediminicola TaxID=458836 RepID=UPI0038BD2C9B
MTLSGTGNAYPPSGFVIVFSPCSPALPAQRFYLPTMNFKAIIQKIASWFSGEAKAIEKNVIEKAQSEFGTLRTVVEDGRTYIAGIGFDVAGRWVITKDGEFTIQSKQPEVAMSAPAADTQAATAGNNVNTAVQIALALKSVDTSLTVEQVQAGTNAALAALYPAAA